MTTSAARWLSMTAAAAAALGLLAGCGPGGGAAEDGKLSVVTGFYPLEWTASRVGGDRVSASSLTPPGAEPHDLELTPKDVATVADADLVVYLHGFQPALDQAAESEGGDRAWDAAVAADLSLTAAPEEGEDDEGGDRAPDPHFWLDPLRLADVGDAMADRLAEVDPDGASGYERNAATLRADLEALDQEMKTGLASCRVDTLVTSHQAFGYLAQRYGFQVVGVSGLSPSQEPDPAQLARISHLVEERGVTTVYTETLVDPAVADTVAREAGVNTAVLDPIEGLSDQSAGDDYLQVMRSNLATLQEGQSCS